MSNSGVFVSGLMTYSASVDADCSLLFFSTRLHLPSSSAPYLQPFPYSLVNCSDSRESSFVDNCVESPRASAFLLDGFSLPLERGVCVL